MKKILAAIFAASITIFASIPALAVSTSAESAILIEAESGDVLYEKDADARRGPASTTKIMTAIIAIERCPLDKVVKVAPEAAGVEGSSVYLYAGEKITMESLLYALMLQSANDAAAAIAYEVAGGIEEFAALMNEKAAELGLGDTHFVNPHGLDDEDHYTTARELSQIARYAMQNETFKKIVSTKKMSIPMHDGEATRVLINHNRLLSSYDDIIGVKTGFTKKTGRTLVSAAERDGLTLIAVTLADGDDWRDHRAMLDYGFEIYENVALCRAGDLETEVHVCGGETDAVTVSAKDDVFAALPKARGEISVRLELTRFVYAPVNAGENVGKAKFYLDGKLMGETALVAENDAKKKDGGGGFLFWKKK